MKPPRIDGAPGLAWKKRRNGWEARWQARADLIARGFTIKSRRLWSGPFGTEPDPTQVAYIQDTCTSLQDEMLVFGRGGVPHVELKFDGTVGGLIDCYRTDRASAYHKKRYRDRLYYDALCKRIRQDLGDCRIDELKARKILAWHEDEFLKGGQISMGSSVIKMLRILINFGASVLEDTECNRVSFVLGKTRFKIPKPRLSVLTAEHATAIRKAAHDLGLPSIALAQATQYDLMLRQKDVIGEYIPIEEPGISDVLAGKQKWLRGIRWEEVNDNMILTHITSKRQKEITVDLKLAPMVMEELGHPISRSQLPARGPIIVSEETGLPWNHITFRERWRKIANKAGVPKTVRNMDSRAGAITEATEAGAELEHIKQAATHSDISMTQRYARGAEEKTAGVMRKRAEHRRNKMIDK